MARFAVAGRSTVAGTALRAIASLFATATVVPRIYEVGVFNTTATAVAVGLARFTNATGVGAGLTEIAMDDPVHVAVATGFAGHTADGAVSGLVRAAMLGAAIGSGVIWTFGGTGLAVPAGTANGVGITIPTGTGQICDYYIEWD
jgi:hypothetical protein